MQWNEIRRFVNFRRSLGFEEDLAQPIACGGRLQHESIKGLRRAIFASCLVAREMLRKISPSRTSSTTDRQSPLLLADVDEARQIFSDALQQPQPSMEALTEVFMPTALLYQSSRPEGDAALLGLRDETSTHELMKGLIAAGDAVGSRRYRTLGDTFFVPPALRGEGRKRRQWIQATRLDPPSSDERGGPYWRLGKWNLWRLEVLSWHERLLLAALVATSSPVAVAMGPASLFPRIGFVTQASRDLGRTLIGIPLEACPQELSQALAEASLREFTGVEKMFRSLRDAI